MSQQRGHCHLQHCLSEVHLCSAVQASCVCQQGSKTHRQGIIPIWLFQKSFNVGNLLNAGDCIDTNIVPGKLGITIELCAGIIDKVDNNSIAYDDV